MELHIEEKYQPIKKLCKMFGNTKQAYYQRIAYTYQEQVKGEILFQEVKKHRKDMPRIGGRKLQYLINKELPEEFHIGRDKFFKWLRDNNLLIKKRRVRIFTTNSHHWLHKYPDLIKDYVVTAPNQLWVSDITYIKTEEGVMYLFLLTDAYSKKILGWKLSDNLGADNAVETLKMALRQWKDVGYKLIHHSDRGVQYCSAKYVKLLKKKGIEISMTQDGNPLDNAIAERINGILKDEWLYDIKITTKEQALIEIRKIIKTYNNKRPHLSLGMRTPQCVHQDIIPNEMPKKMWKNYYSEERSECEAKE